MKVKVKYIIFVAITIIGVMSDMAGYTTVPASYHFSETVDLLKTVEMKSEIELWKTIEGFENYEISSLGRVNKLNHRGTGRKRALTPSLNGRYLSVRLFPGRKNKYIHRLIAESFINKVKNKPLVLHKNDISIDNRIENLYWGDYSENQYDKIKNGYIASLETRRKTSISTRGEKSGMSILKENEVIKVKELLISTNKSHVEIAEMFGISKTTIWHISKGNTWKHVKF